VNAEAGFSYASLDSLNSHDLELKNSSSAGGMFGLGAGVRLLIFTLGARARVDELTTYSLWELGGELGIHVPMKKWDPYFGFRGGYALAGSLSQVLSKSANQISIHGAYAGMMFGADYYFLPYLSAGVDFSPEGLFLTRPPAKLPGDFAKLPPAAQKAIENQPLYKDSGDSVGFGLAGSLHLGLHL
jgi:hypothetical protein